MKNNFKKHIYTCFSPSKALISTILVNSKHQSTALGYVTASWAPRPPLGRDTSSPTTSPESAETALLPSHSTVAQRTPHASMVLDQVCKTLFDVEIQDCRGFWNDIQLTTIESQSFLRWIDRTVWAAMLAVSSYNVFLQASTPRNARESQSSFLLLLILCLAGAETSGATKHQVTPSDGLWMTMFSGI